MFFLFFNFVFFNCCVTISSDSIRLAVATDRLVWERFFRNLPWLLLRKRSGTSCGSCYGYVWGASHMLFKFCTVAPPSPLLSPVWWSTVAAGDRLKFGVVMTTSSALMEENVLTLGPFPPPLPIFSHHPLSLPTPPPCSHWSEPRPADVQPGLSGHGGCP